MKQYSEIIIRPVLSEKTYSLQNKENIYTFEVAPKSSKTMIKEAIEKLFKVNVKDVNIVNTKPRKKRVGRYQGKISGIRKAYVKLMPGETIGENPNQEEKAKAKKKK